MKTRKRTKQRVQQEQEEPLQEDQQHEESPKVYKEEGELEVLFKALASGNIQNFDQDVISKYRTKTIEELLTMQCELHSESIRKYALEKAEEFTHQLEQVKEEIKTHI